MLGIRYERDAEMPKTRNQEPEFQYQSTDWQSVQNTPILSRSSNISKVGKGPSNPLWEEFWNEISHQWLVGWSRFVIEPMLS